MVGRSDRLFIAIATAGKLSFVALVVCTFWSIDAMPLRAPILASADLILERYSSSGCSRARPSPTLSRPFDALRLQVSALP